MRVLSVVSSIAFLFVVSACAGPTAAVKPGTQVAAASEPNSACLSETGSRIPKTGTGCSAFGHSYSNEDINRTGSTTAGGSLRLMDPSVTVH
jgi:hypothetical protein